MTKEEFRERIENLIEEFDPNHEFDMFMIMAKPNTKEVYTTGFGCEGCMTDVVLAMKAKGAFTHNNSEGTKH